MFSELKPVLLTSKAAIEVRKIMETKNIPADYGLRVGVKGGGCGGVSLIIGFDKKKDSDHAYTIDNIPIYVDKKHTMYLIGKEVDFYEGEDARGFMFTDQIAVRESTVDGQQSTADGQQSQRTVDSPP